METSPAQVWGADVVHLSNLSHLNPEIPSCPILVKLFLQDNHTLTDIPSTFLINMPILQVLDLSHTSIQSLPSSISNLISLQEFILRDCSLLMELPPEIGSLKSLKLFDLEGTEIMYLPKEIGKLKNLEYLRVSLSLYADDYIERKGIETVIPRRTISKLNKLKELSIGVNPEAEWWEIEVTETILEDLRFLPDLETLKLYLPTAKAVQHFLQLQSFRVPIYASLLNFRLIVGQTEQVSRSLPPQVEENFVKLEKCLKYVNGDGITGEDVELVKNARALFLCRHWTITKLSIFDTEKLKYCLIMECNEMKTLVDVDKYRCDKQTALGSLQYLGIYFMKKLQRIWIGPMSRVSLSCLRFLTLHTCPELRTVFTEPMLGNLLSLTELVVEDCPKVISLVTLESAPWSFGRFLRNLRRISLLDLPELVSISSGMCIAPGLQSLLVFNCMKLDHLSDKELPPHIKEIKGEIEWWNALKCDKSIWGSTFLELKRDGDLMDQLAEDTNSLPFHEMHLPLPVSMQMAQLSFMEHVKQQLKVPLSSEETQDKAVALSSSVGHSPVSLTDSSLTPDDEALSVVTECSVHNESIDGQSEYAGIGDERSKSPDPKVRKAKLGDKITTLQQLVAPFGKTDTASVLLETMDYISFLQAQITDLMYTKGAPTRQQQQAKDISSKGPRQDLRSRGLCLVPVSSTSFMKEGLSSPTFREPSNKSEDIKKDKGIPSLTEGWSMG